MFIISLDYIKPITVVEEHLAAHREFLEEGFNKGYFLLAGRKNPRTGGIIISSSGDKALLEEFIKSDPFYLYQIAEFSITEFIPTMACSGLGGYINSSSN